MSQKATILVTDDDRGIRTVLTQALTRTGYNVIPLSDGASLMRRIEDGEGDLVITDVVLPDSNGLELIPQIKALRPEIKIIAMSAQTTLMTAVKATEMGAFEYLPKPFDINELSALVNSALEENKSSTYTNNQATIDDNLPIIGRSAAMQDIYRTIARLLNTDLTVLVTGESGTGKELVARALHDFGKRRAMPFVALNMAAIPRDLIESELFGYEKGAFSGAAQRNPGRFSQAEGGTLFLDEIGDMPIDAQTRLLRVLQEGEYSTVGGRASVKTDVRIVAATHHDLTQLIQEGKFREDLYFRLNVVPITIPPLRERIDDIPELANFFLRKAVEANLPTKHLSKKAEEHLKRYTWPGNVRELENLMQRLTILAVEDVIPPSLVESEIADTARSLAPNTEEGGIGGSVDRHLVSYFLAHKGRLPAAGLYERIIREVEKPLIALTLDATGGNQIRAAAVLGLNRNTLRKKIKDLGIDIVRGSGAKR